MNLLLPVVASILIVFFGSLLFVNAIEYVGGLLNWSKSFLGAIVSPFFTSFPELIVFIIAIFSADHVQGHDIAIGVIFGEPFVSSSIAYTMVLVAILGSLFMTKRRKKTMDVDKGLSYPYLFVSVLYPFLILAGYLTRSLNIVLGIVFLASYVVYAYIMYREDSSLLEEEQEEPFLGRIMNPRYGAVLQLAAAIVLLYFGSELIVHSISDLSTNIGIDALTLSIIIIPFATVIPETLTAMIWGYQGKDTFAIASLVGEKVLYTTLYPGIALLMIPWAINESAIISVITAEVISLIYLFYIRRGKFPLYALSFGLAFFVLYIYLVL